MTCPTKDTVFEAEHETGSDTKSQRKKKLRNTPYAAQSLLLMDGLGGALGRGAAIDPEVP